MLLCSATLRELLFFDKIGVSEDVSQYLREILHRSENLGFILASPAEFIPHYTLLRLGIMGYTVHSYGRRFFEKRYPPRYISNEAWKNKAELYKITVTIPFYTRRETS